MSVNKVLLLGNLGKDPETIITPSGMKITKAVLATSKSFKKNDEWQEKTEWHNLITFDKRAETLEGYVKGDNIWVEGEIQTSSWEGDDGVKKYKTEIVVGMLRREQKANRGETQAPAQAPTQTDGPKDDLPF